MSALLGGETSKHYENVYYLNCFHSYATKNKLEKHYIKYAKIMIIVMQKYLMNTIKY